MYLLKRHRNASALLVLIFGVTEHGVSHFCSMSTLDRLAIPFFPRQNAAPESS